VLAPTTTKRTAETNVQVRDGQTVVIAGLVGDNVDVSTTKVPCLGDIPIVGWLFKSETRNTTRTNLLIFLTPYIVATPEEAEEIYRQKATYMDELSKSAPDQDGQPEEPAPAPASSGEVEGSPSTSSTGSGPGGSK
jgi:general secretion pathway protein D